MSLGISTMAAAGLGNLISDLAGLGLAHQVEVLYRSLGIPDPQLSPSQRAHRYSKWMGLVVSCCHGNSVLCVIICGNSLSLHPPTPPSNLIPPFLHLHLLPLSSFSLSIPPLSSSLPPTLPPLGTLCGCHHRMSHWYGSSSLVRPSKET